MNKKIFSFSIIFLLLTQLAVAQTLKDVYKDAFRLGSAVNQPIVSGQDEASQKVLLKHFNSITSENVLKAGPINPKPGVYNFGPVDAYVAFGEKNNMFIVGHTLVWHNQTNTDPG